MGADHGVSEYEIHLEDVYKDGKLIGRKFFLIKDLTPELIREIKLDSEDSKGLRKYWGVFDNKIRDKWRAVKIE
ncbi:unnamed protein product [marine sediment metagenome]|uniref:Uncharacterized protein n=1 Tax=marine sediment metagenome TaxID=412755 RepID=X0Z6Z7_9ZZZZ